MHPDPFDVEAAPRLRSYERRIDRLETLEAPSGGGGDFILIEHQTTIESQASVEFTDIPAVHKHLFVIYSVAGTKVNPETTMSVQINSDFAANYSYMQRIMRADDTQATNSSTPTSVVTIGLEGNSAERHAPGWALIPDYLGTNNEKAVRSGGFADFGAGGMRNTVMGGMWKTINDPISTLRFFLGGAFFKAGSVISLYGIN